MIEQERSLRGEDIIWFVKEALHQMAAKLLVVGYGSSAHCEEAVRGFLKSAGASGFQLEQLLRGTRQG